MANKLILASSSPRRQELLNQVGVSFSIRKANIDESQVTATDPKEKVKQLAILKGRAVSLNSIDEVILSADTVVSFNHKIFEKPKGKAEAYEMISSLSGKTHEVFTGVLIRSFSKERAFVERTTVVFWPLSEEEKVSYLNTTDPYDKAGAYGIQSLGAIFVKQIIGDYYNVVGLPLSRVARELKEFDVNFISN